MSDKQISPYSELMPRSLQEKVEMAKYLAQSGLMPGGLQTPAQVLVALQMGHELGLSPMIAVNNIAVINGRPSLSSSIMDAIVMNRPDYAGRSIKFEGEGETRSCTVTVQRKIGENVETFEGYFSMRMAKDAGLLDKKGEVWKHYPDRMLKARASGYADKDGWPDALAGMISQEEAESIPPEPRDVTPKKAPDSVKKGGIDVLIPIEELDGMLSPDERKQIDEKMKHVEKFIEDNKQYLTEDTIQFAQNKARENCLRQFYRLGKEPTRYLEELTDKMREQVKAAKEKEADEQEKKSAEKAGGKIDEITAAANEGWELAEDAEVVKEDPPKGELDIF